MSRNTTLMLLCVVSLIGFAFSQVNQRQPASVKKIEFLTSSEIDNLRHTSKVHGSLNFSMSPASETAYQVGIPFILKAVVESDELLKDVQIDWILPEDMQLVSGEAHTTIAELQPNTPLTLEVVIFSNSGENQKVFARASANKGSNRFSENVQFNTLDQQLIEYEKAELKKRTLETIKQQGTRTKIFR